MYMEGEEKLRGSRCCGSNRAEWMSTFRTLSTCTPTNRLSFPPSNSFLGLLGEMNQNTSHTTPLAEGTFHG